MTDRVQSLRIFLKASRGQPQEEILKEFLLTIIKENEICDSGSLLINYPKQGHLRLFESQFHKSRGVLTTNAEWPQVFQYTEGIAGRCFRTRSTQIVNQAHQHDEFVKGENIPIENLICVPILIPQNSQAFGVASFHNADRDRQFSQNDCDMIEAYADALGLALAASRRPINLDEPNLVFIVHGRDLETLAKLELGLRRRSVEPLMVKDGPGDSRSILQHLESQVDRCTAGFVLMTGDDEARVAGEGGDWKLRARQNVVLEGGMLMERFGKVKRVCFLVVPPIEWPSDWEGIKYESFDGINFDRIETVLDSWGVQWKKPGV